MSLDDAFNFSEIFLDLCSIESDLEAVKYFYEKTNNYYALQASHFSDVLNEYNKNLKEIANFNALVLDVGYIKDREPIKKYAKDFYEKIQDSKNEISYQLAEKLKPDFKRMEDLAKEFF